ncbi:glycosyltransferase family 4 protein [Aequorivita sinensis]|uniref:glycosyltransferase family 4 protein n=1 Tax=Aequorivita sinensis TaxID=1382458 RepID=UPI0021D087AE|nr:glycosyltransferase family 4 protein [Aequorivita sinensis]
MDKQMQFMIEKDCDIHVIVPKDELYMPQLKVRDANVNFHDVSLKREISPFWDLISLFQIIKLLFRIKADVIHLHTPKASFLGALAARVTFQKMIIYQMHGLVSTEGVHVKKNVIYYLEKVTCSLVDRVFAVSLSLKNYAIKNKYCKSSKIEVIGNGTINGIDWQERFNPKEVINPSKYLTKTEIKDKFVIGFIGRLSEEKGVVDFIDVVAAVSKKYSILAVLVGPNEMGEKLNRILKSNENLNDNNFKRIEEIHDPENILSAFDVLLFPTKREGFGLSAAEANAMEVPVVAYDIPGIKDAVENGVSGKLVPYGDIKRLEKSIIEYIHNPEVRKTHGVNGRNRVVELYDRKALWLKTFNRYQELVTG